MGINLVSKFLLPPAGPLLGIVLALLLKWMGWRKTAALLAFVAVASLWALSTPKVADELARGLEGEVKATAIVDLPEADAIVLLGGSLGAPHPPRESADLADAADRVLHAARLARAGKAKLVVATGGYPARVAAERSESEEAAALLIEWGVPEAAILVEGGSLDTHQNAVETQRLLEARGANTVLLVTSATHMPRALATFRAVGLDAIPAPTDYAAVEGEEPSILDWIPNAEALALSKRVLHEWLGRVYYRVRGWT